jgi:hypothetical protein
MDCEPETERFDGLERVQALDANLGLRHRGLHVLK